MGGSSNDNKGGYFGKNLESVFNRLVDDEHFETQLLFRSPSGDGLKWIVTIDITEQMPHAKYFKASLLPMHSAKTDAATISV